MVSKVDDGKDYEDELQEPTVAELKTRLQNAEYVVSLLKQFLETATGQHLGMSNKILRRAVIAISCYEQNMDPEVAKLSQEIAEMSSDLLQKLRERDERIRKALETKTWEGLHGEDSGQ